MTLLLAEPTSLWLEISSTTQTQSWQQSRHYYPPGNMDAQAQSASWRAYLNHLCLQTFLDYLEEEENFEASAYPSTQTLFHIWSVVDGAAISLGNKRLVLIPTPTLGEGELRVPQEWIDIPNWVGDYYLGVKIYPDDQELEIVGYTTHAQLKNKGSYDPQERYYCLDRAELIEDVSVLWVALELCPEERTKVSVPSLPTLPVTQAESLVQRLGNREVVRPRLAVPFEHWGALLEQENYLEQIYLQRQNVTQVNLSQWFDNLFASGWQSLDTLFPDRNNLAFSLRGNSTQVKRVKLIELENQAVVLALSLSSEDDGRVGIRTQLYPAPTETHLPEGVRLDLLSSTGESLKSVRARGEDDFVQIQRFKCAQGYRFNIQVSLDDISVREIFVV